MKGQGTVICMSSNDIEPYERRFLEKGVVARSTGPMGWGLFAETHYSPGEPIFWLDLQDDTRSIIIPDREAFGPCHERSVTILPDFAFCCLIEHPFWNVNHTCDGNSGFVNWGRIEDGKMPFVAYRDIAPGEQITCDYSLMTTPYDGTPEGGPWEMTCLCGLPGCRHLITGFDRLPRALQLEAILPSGDGPRGRVLAHILAEESPLVEALKAQPLLHLQFLDVLRQHQDVSTFLHRVMG